MRAARSLLYRDPLDRDSPGQRPPPPDSLDRDHPRERNITLPQTLFAGGNKKVFQSNDNNSLVDSTDHIVKFNIS